jgi:hypothetical protein
VLRRDALAAPDTIDTMPEKTLLAFDKSWQELLKRIASKSAMLEDAAHP